ncbi:MAG: ferritin-like domain-containing protein [bacterium]|nr:ferritin-like domain-containing protein [bacterium]
MEKLIFTKEHITEADLLEEVLADAVEGNRRKFLKRGAVAASAMAMAGMWLGQKRTILAADDGRTDVQLLAESFTLEQQAVNTYAAAASLKSPDGLDYISGPVLSVALRFKADHTAHALRFKEVLEQLGGTVPADTTTTTLTAFPPGANSKLDSTRGILRYALAVEVFAMKLWVDYFRYSEDARARRVFMDLAPNEGAHAAILRAALKLVLSEPTDYDNADVGKAIVPHIFVSQDGPVF